MDNITLKKILRSQEKLIDQLATLRMEIKRRDPSPWMSIPEAASYAGFSRSYFYKIYKEIPHFQRQDRVMIHVDDLNQWMDKNKITL